MKISIVSVVRRDENKGLLVSWKAKHGMRAPVWNSRKSKREMILLDEGEIYGQIDIDGFDPALEDVRRRVRAQACDALADMKARVAKLVEIDKARTKLLGTFDLEPRRVGR